MMKRLLLLTALFTPFLFKTGYSQLTQGNILSGELKGLVLDKNTGEPLPYTNIYVLHKHTGTVSNENGRFVIDVSALDKDDTLRFQYIGYKTRNLAISRLDTMVVVYLKEEIFNLNETVVFGSAPDPESIVKNVIRYKDSNYRKTNCMWKAFIRERYTTDINELNFDYKKSSIDELDRETVTQLERKIPRHTTSYTDFLGNIYLPENKDDTLKVDPVRMVELEEKNMADLKEMETLFQNVISGTGENEYWKVKTGIFGQKIDLTENDTLPEKDTLHQNQIKTVYFCRRTASNLSYRLLTNKDDWEFLYNTKRYKYTLAGGIRMNGEDVYIIDFEPDKSGNFTGRMYVTTSTFALIRADYEYAPGKIGTNIHLLGIGYTENGFIGSIYFEKRNDNYVLKYFSKKVVSDASFDRNLALLKKRKRFLFDKTLKEIKIGINIAVTSESSVEVLVLDEKEITQKQFNSFTPKEYMDVIYVDQFDENLWKGYSIIEPTRQMREYKKQKIK